MDLSRWLSGPPVAVPPARLREDWVNSLNGFALALGARMARDRSYAVSPHNIASALALLAAGARGDTLDRLCRTLGIAADVDAVAKFGRALRRVVPRGEASPLVVGASVWHDRRLILVPEYVELATGKFAARVSPVDFGRAAETADDVNAWIVDLTRGNITNLISARDITPDMVAILCTGMFFKGTWKTKFDVALTTPGVFQGINGNIDVSMMNGTVDTVGCDTPLFQAAALHYGHGEIDLVIVLPQPAITLERVREVLSNPSSLEREFAKAEPRRVAISLPRYGLETREEMIAHLEALGLGDISGPGADFSGMSEVAFGVSKIRHALRIQVDEEGTVAAAATYAGLVLGGPRRLEYRPMTMRVDRPFLFLLRDCGSGAILFCGQILGERKDLFSRATPARPLPAG